MSHTFFNKQWQEVQQEISNLMVEECPEEPVKPETDQTVHFQTVATLYVSLFCYCFKEKQLYENCKKIPGDQRALFRKVINYYLINY